jgi:GAF domain-containing protein
VTREDEVVQSLVDLADALAPDYDVAALLDCVTDRCVQVLGAAGASATLVSPTGELRLVAASSQTMRTLALYELRAQEGPCLDAIARGEAVEHETLRPGTGPWPRYSTVAVKAGYQSACALPLQRRDTTIGALTLVAVDPTPMCEADIRVARAFTDLATISILRQRAAYETRRVNEQLRHALTSRIVIEQAKGVICERAGVSVAEAFSRLRNYARCHNLRLADVARAATERTLNPAEWATTTNHS